MVRRRRKQSGGLVQPRRGPRPYNPYPDWYLDKGSHGQMGGGKLIDTGKRALNEIGDVAKLTYRKVKRFTTKKVKPKITRLYRKIKGRITKKKTKTKVKRRSVKASKQRGGRVQPVDYQYYQ